MFYPSTRRWMPCVYRTGKKLSKWEFSTTSVKRNHQNHEKARSSSCIRRSDPVLYRFPKRISHSPTCPFQKKIKPFGDRHGIYRAWPSEQKPVCIPSFQHPPKPHEKNTEKCHVPRYQSLWGRIPNKTKNRQNLRLHLFFCW